MEGFFFFRSFFVSVFFLFFFSNKGKLYFFSPTHEEEIFIICIPYCIQGEKIRRNKGSACSGWNTCLKMSAFIQLLIGTLNHFLGE